MRLMTDASGAGVGDPQNYDPFGNTGDASNSPIDYSGEWKDASGLTYLRARYYDPSTGAFISQDPLSGSINDPASMNGFDYADDNPIMGSDPSGRMCEIVDPFFSVALCLAELATLYGPEITNMLPQMNFQSSWRPQSESDFSALMAGNLAGLSNPVGESEVIEMELQDLIDNGALAETEAAQLMSCSLPIKEDWLQYVPDPYKQRVANSFEGTPTVVKLSSDMKVYRYWGGTSKEIGSPYFSLNSTLSQDNARSLLALPNTNTAEHISEYIIPKDTIIIVGKANSKELEPDIFGFYATGGGLQVYLPDPTSAIRSVQIR